MFKKYVEARNQMTKATIILLKTLPKKLTSTC